MTASRLILAVGVLLIGGFIWSLRAPIPGIASGDTAPVPSGEWKWLNNE